MAGLLSDLAAVDEDMRDADGVQPRDGRRIWKSLQGLGVRVEAGWLKPAVPVDDRLPVPGRIQHVVRVELRASRIGAAG